MKDLTQFLKESNGNYSSSRLFMLLICLAVITDYQHAVWTVGVWHPDWQTIAMVLGSLGFKVFQKKDESIEAKE